MRLTQSTAKKPSFLFAGMWFGGTATVLQNLHNAIGARDDVDSTWIHVEFNPKELIARIPPISLNWTLKGGLIARSRIRALEKSGKVFDAAYFNGYIPASFIDGFRQRVPSVMAMDITPMLMNNYGMWYGVPSSDGKHPIEKLKFIQIRKTYRNTDYLLPWTTWVKESLIDDYGIDEKKIMVLPPGINLKQWNCKERRSLTSAKTRVLFVGLDFTRKGGDLLCKIARREAFHECEFQFVTHSYVGEMSSNIFVHNGVQPNSMQLIELYKQSDIFVLPTRADFLPMAMLEAMSMKLPVLSTNVGGVSEMVAEGDSGFLIPSEDEHALVDRLTRLIRNPELRAEMGERARKRVEVKFDLEKNAEALLEVLCRAARDKSGSLN